MGNRGGVVQIMKFNFVATEGKTDSITHSANFNLRNRSDFQCWPGFPGIGEINCQLSFDFSHNRSFQESINKTITKSNGFDLVVPAHCTQIARATVQEAKLEVPFELIFDFNGVIRSVTGLWKGVGCSKATY